MNVISKNIVLPTFLLGLARIFDFTGQIPHYNLSADPMKSDAEAIASDWKAVGMDIQYAMDEFARQENIHVKQK